MHSGGGSTRTPPPSIKMGTSVDGSVGGGSVKGGCVVAVVVGGAVVSAALVVVGAVVVAFPFREACLLGAARTASTDHGDQQNRDDDEHRIGRPVCGRADSLKFDRIVASLTVQTEVGLRCARLARTQGERSPGLRGGHDQTRDVLLINQGVGPRGDTKDSGNLDPRPRS